MVYHIGRSALVVALVAAGIPLRERCAHAADISIVDLAKAQPDEVKVAFENEFVRVTRIDLDPGEALPDHVGARRVVYALSNFETQWSDAGKDSVRRSWTAGAAHAHGAGGHALKNIGSTAASFIVFERLAAPLPKRPAGATQAQYQGKALFADRDFRLAEITLQPGQGQEMHPGGWRAVYSLSDSAIEWREHQRIEPKSWAVGSAHWHAPGLHAAKNIGDRPARWLVLEVLN